MRTFVKSIAIIIVVASLVNLLYLASQGYWEHIEGIRTMVFVSILGYCIFLYGHYVPLIGKEKRDFEEGIIQAARALERKALREKMTRWNKELTDEEKSGI